MRRAAGRLAAACLLAPAAVAASTPNALGAQTDPPIAASTPADSLADAAALRRRKQVEWPRAYRDQDVPLLDRILAPEFQMTDADGGRSTKAEELTWVRAHRPGYDSLTFVVERLDVFDRGAAVVAGTGVMHGRDADGRPTVTEYRSTNVFVKRRGEWRAVASHVSGVRRRPDGG